MRAVRSGGPTSHPTLVIATPPPPCSYPPSHTHTREHSPPPGCSNPPFRTRWRHASPGPAAQGAGTLPPPALSAGAVLFLGLRRAPGSSDCAELPARSGGGGKWLPVALRSLCLCSPPGGGHIGLGFRFCDSPSPSVFSTPGPGRGSCCVSTRCGPPLSKLVGTAFLGDRGQPCFPVWPGLRCVGYEAQTRVWNCVELRDASSLGDRVKLHLPEPMLLECSWVRNTRVHSDTAPAQTSF